MIILNRFSFRKYDQIMWIRYRKIDDDQIIIVEHDKNRTTIFNDIP